MPWNKTDRSFKTLISKRTTDSDLKFFFNEKGDNTINVHASEIWLDAIPGDPATSAPGVVETRTLFVLTEDLSVANQQSWFATTDTDPATRQSNEAARLKDWISDKYDGAGVFPGYTLKLFDAADRPITTTDQSGWFFDYQTGILTFNGANLDPATDGTPRTVAASGPYKVTGYRFVGVKGVGGGTIDGTGTAGTVPLWQDADTLTDSIMTQADGVITIDGNLEAVSKNFVIPHPTKAGKKLVYGCLEGPENGAYHRGTITGRGRARVDLPDYWRKLVDDNYTVLLTPRTPCLLYVPFQGPHAFQIARAGLLGRWLPFTCDFLVIGSRRDAPLVIERDA
jgi:hypothetical protein